jgi:hypothetical protein
MKNVCPLLKKECIEHQCAWYTHVLGKNPQTAKDMDHWDCAVKWLPLLITESARQTHNVAASVDSMRNEVIERQDVLNNAVGRARPQTPPRLEDGGNDG